jgi:hypothetical protein
MLDWLLKQDMQVGKRFVGEITHANIIYLLSDHCIEYIRENLMCKPDISLITYKWVNGTRGNEKIGESKTPLPSNKDLSDHECVNWDRINSWAEDRAFDLFRLDLLQMPDGEK